MRHATALLVTATCAWLCPAYGQADDKLVLLIPNLFGPQGLVVDSEARLPSGETHSAHFNSVFQAEFRQFNIALASQLTAVPLPSPASGFTYTFDPALAESGLFRRTTQSFGPILADRAETVGRRKLAVGISYQRFTFDRLEGVDLDNLNAVFTHDEATPGGRADVVTTVNALEATVSQLTAFLNYGLTDRVDVSLALPLLDTSLTVVSEATVRRIGTIDPRVHFFRDPSGGIGNVRSFRSSGSATGIGDVLMRVKANVWHRRSGGLALGLEGRLPTGDEEDLLGSGTLGLKPFLALSINRGRVAPHLNVGYQWNGDSVLAGDVRTGAKADFPDQFSYAAGVDVGVGARATVAVELLGRRVSASPRLVSETFQALDGRTTFPNLRFLRNSFHQADAAVGFKANPVGRLLVDFNLLLALNDSGLRDRVTPLLGIEYTF